VGHKQTHYLSFWQKEIDSLGKFNFFTLNRFAIDYNNQNLNNFSIESQLTYQFNNWFGLSVGGAYEGENFIPSVGLNLGYYNEQQNFFIEVYPTLLIEDIKSFSILGVVGYNPSFTTNWSIFSQLIFSTNLQTDKDEINTKRDILGLFTMHQQSTQLIRLGLSYNEKFQFGIGGDFNQFSYSIDNFNNYGIFIRLIH
jgi:hypothetical protein